MSNSVQEVSEDPISEHRQLPSTNPSLQRKRSRKGKKGMLNVIRILRAGEKMQYDDSPGTVTVKPHDRQIIGRDDKVEFLLSKDDL